MGMEIKKLIRKSRREKIGKKKNNRKKNDKKQ